MSIRHDEPKEDDDRTDKNGPFENTSAIGNLSMTVASFDKGGGVEWDGHFLVFTAVPPPQLLHPDDLDPISQEELDTAATKVGEHVRILTSADTLDLSSLRSIPSEHASRTTKPWYFINASKSSKFCLIGPSRPSSILISLLRRPWCLLELCCTPLAILQALHIFTLTALRVDKPRYSVAACLLQYETAARAGQCSMADSLRSNDWLVHSIEDLHVYTREYAGPIYHSAWLHAIYDYMYKFNVSVREVARMLNDPDRDMDWIRVALGPDRRSSMGLVPVRNGASVGSPGTEALGDGELLGWYQCRACKDRGQGCEHCGLK